MAVEYSAIAVQEVASNSPVIFTQSPVPCNRGFVFHRDGSGIFLLSSYGAGGYIGCGCSCGCNNYRMPQVQYSVEFHGNIAIPTDGTVEEIQLAIAIDGETDSNSIMRITPAAVDEYGNVGTSVVVSVPAICRCSSISVRNISTQAIEVQNANILINRLGVSR